MVSFYGANIFGDYYIKDDLLKTTILTDRLNIKQNENSNFISLTNIPIKTKFEFDKDDFKFKIYDFNSSFFKKDKTYTLTIDGVENLFFVSQFLQKFQIDNGNVEVKTNNFDIYRINGKTEYRKNIFLDSEYKRVKDIDIKGIYNSKELFLSLNEKIILKVVEDKQRVDIKDININLDEILDLINSGNSKTDNNSTLIVNAQNSNTIFKKNRVILSDSYTAKVKDDNIVVNLKYKDGNVSFKKYDNNYTLKIDNINDEFIKKVTKFKWFLGGKFDITSKVVQIKTP